jgi:hypothetical protein
MLHAGLDLSRGRLDVCVISEPVELVEKFPAPPDADGYYGLEGLKKYTAERDWWRPAAAPGQGTTPIAG